MRVADLMSQNCSEAGRHGHPVSMPCSTRVRNPALYEADSVLAPLTQGVVRTYKHAVPVPFTRQV